MKLLCAPNFFLHIFEKTHLSPSISRQKVLTVYSTVIEFNRKTHHLTLSACGKKTSNEIS